MKKYITQFLQYMSPEILVTLLPFITLPITTHYLTLQDFGLIAIFTLALIPFTVISEFGSAFILSSEWFNRSCKERRPLISSLLFLSFSIRLIAIILVSIAAPFLFPILFHDSSSFIIGLFYLLVLQFFFQSFDQIFSQWLILSEKASLYTKVKLLEIILSTSNMIFLSIYTQNVTFILIGQTLIAFILFLIRGFFLVPYITYFNRDLCYEFLKIGYPFFFRSLFNQSRKTIDKLFTSSSATIESFALYNWAVRFYDLYITLESHFVKVYSPKLLSDLANESQKNYKKVFSPWFGLVLFFSTVFFFFGKEIITYISNGLYTGAFPLILIITCICLFKAAFQGSMAPLIHYKKSLKILVITILGAAGNIAACYFLIPHLGISGGLIGIFVGMLVIEMGYFIEKTMLIKLVYFEIEGLIFSILYSSFIASYLIFNSPIGIPLVFINIIFFVFLFQIMLKNRH